MQVTTIGLDIAKRVFQAHGVDEAGRAVLRRKLQRVEVLTFFRGLPPCLVGIEACGTAHHWAREIRALGHEIRLMPASYVKPYVKRGKTDAADAEAICEAVTRPTMRFVPVKTPEQQAVLMLHRTRDLLVRQRTMLVNALRGHMAEFGVIAPQGISRVTDLLAVLLGEDEAVLPMLARQALRGLAAELESLGERIEATEAAILTWHKGNETSRRLATIPGIGPITASALVASLPDPTRFRSARHLAAWIGLVPRQNSSGGKERQGGISKQGDRTLRRLLVLGAVAVIRHARTRSAAEAGWLKRLLERRPAKLAAVAQANKTARIVWALLTRGGTYRAPTMPQPAPA
ncbi:IS110 family transposase [Roseomonas nepalensis]|uniref:IS110 family transposase n=2 Tax=Muricoccus nepalensis TaxID=1854500 RepID=A0A502ED24_9PROT|nr:IS110 family transposase [Roseomonas nepalensis]TPG34872.1 IS110 family transposase [Roseomonas nepalensis]